MADGQELKNMVMSFRVSELQVLLGFAGRCRSGRKSELLNRALSLVEKGPAVPIQVKIRELYRRRFPPKTGVGGGGGGGGSGVPPQDAASPLALKSPTLSPSSSSLASVYSHPMDYQRSLSGPTPPQAAASSQVPVHPDVRFKRLPFFDVLGELLKPSSLAQRTSNRFQETFFVFHLTPQQTQDISMNRDMRPQARCEYTVQIQLRFCLLETSCPQEDNFPPSICVRVNGKMASLPNPIPTNKPGVEPKRPSRSVNITSICRISPTVPNHVSISWASELGRSYCVAIYLVRRLNSDLLLQRLKHKGVRHPDHTRALIKEKLRHDPDSEIATTSLRVSLMCPLGKMRMTVPSRAKTCNHLQCFDAPTFLQMNEKKATWTCPVCDRTADFDDLQLDGLFTELLALAHDANEIQFSEDGSWQPMREKEEKSMNVMNTSSDVTMIDMADSDSDCATTSKPEASTSGGGGGGDFIDLTETDDEDNAPPTITCDSSPASSSCSSSSSSSSSSVPSSPSVISMAPSKHDGDEQLDSMEHTAAAAADSKQQQPGWQVVQNSPLKLQLKKMSGGSGSERSPPSLHTPCSPLPPSRHDAAPPSLSRQHMDLDSPMLDMLDSQEPVPLMSNSELEALLRPLDSPQHSSHAASPQPHDFSSLYNLSPRPSPPRYFSHFSHTASAASASATVTSVTSAAAAAAAAAQLESPASPDPECSGATAESPSSPPPSRPASINSSPDIIALSP